MTKQEIVDSLSYATGFSKSDSGELLNQLFTSIIDLLNAEGKVKLNKFGTFEVKHKGSRVGRNPETKQEFIIAARNVISFKPSGILKGLINDTRSIKND